MTYKHRINYCAPPPSSAILSYFKKYFKIYLFLETGFLHEAFL